jgi:hypothetical protein
MSNADYYNQQPHGGYGGGNQGYYRASLPMCKAHAYADTLFQLLPVANSRVYVPYFAQMRSKISINLNP